MKPQNEKIKQKGEIIPSTPSGLMKKILKEAEKKRIITETKDRGWLMNVYYTPVNYPEYTQEKNVLDLIDLAIQKTRDNLSFEKRNLNERKFTREEFEEEYAKKDFDIKSIREHLLKHHKMDVSEETIKGVLHLISVCRLCWRNKIENEARHQAHKEVFDEIEKNFKDCHTSIRLVFDEWKWKDLKKKFGVD